MPVGLVMVGLDGVGRAWSGLASDYCDIADQSSDQDMEP